MHAIATMLEAVSAVSTASAVPSQAVQQVGPMCQGITALSGPAEAEAHAAASSVSSPSSAASCATYQLCAALVSAAAGRRTFHGPNKALSGGCPAQLEIPDSTGTRLQAQQQRMHQQQTMQQQQQQQQVWSQEGLQQQLHPQQQQQQQQQPQQQAQLDPPYNQQQQQQQQYKLQVRPDPLQQPEECLSPASQSSLPAVTPTPSSATSGQGSSSRNSTAAVSNSGTGNSPQEDIRSSSGGSSMVLPHVASRHQQVRLSGSNVDAITDMVCNARGGSYGSGCSPTFQQLQQSLPLTGAPGMQPGPIQFVPVRLSSVTDPQPPAAAAAAGAGAGAAAAGVAAAATGTHRSVPRQASFSSNLSPTGPMGGAMLSAGAFAGGLDQQSPPLVQQLGVSVDSLARLFKAEADTEFEQPVWMVINLQGKIKGSYTAEKMLEFCRRGTLGGAQLVLGMDRNLPYNARQELSYYRPLSHLVIAVHHGARYCPLTEDAVTSLARQGLAATQWEPLASLGAESTVSPSDATAADDLAGELQQGLDLSSPGSRAQGSAAMAAGSKRVAAMAAAARLRSVLQRLCCGSGGRMQGGGRPMGRRQTPLWMYINHLGWCRGPFSGGKVIQAHMCGRLPHDTLVVGLEPDVPPALISTDVEFWFRPMKHLIEQVAAGYSYNPVSWQDVAAYSLNQQSGQGSAPEWQPLVYRDTGAPPPFQGGPLPSISTYSNQAAAAAAAAAASGAGSFSPQQLMQQQHQEQQQSPNVEAAAAAMHVSASAGGGSPSMSRAGSMSSGAAAAAAAATAAASGMLAQMSAAMPATGGGVAAQGLGVYGDTGGGFSAAAGSAEPGGAASQMLLMHLLQPQQWQQGDPNAAAAAAAAAAQMQGMYPMPSVPYPMYLMPPQQGGYPVANMGAVGMGPGGCFTATWDASQQLQTQQAMIQNPNMVMGMAGMQFPTDTSSGVHPTGVYHGGFNAGASAGFGAQAQQQFWGQQFAGPRPQATGWTSGDGTSDVAGPEYGLMQPRGGPASMGQGQAAGAHMGQGVLPGVMGNMQFLHGHQQMQ